MAYFRVFVCTASMPVFFAGCASMFSGTQHSVRVHTEPPGALVKADGVTRGVSPAEVHLSPRSEHTIRIERAGSAPVTATVQRHVSPWVFANALNGFLPGLLIDFSTGAFYTLQPTRIEARLHSVGQTSRLP